MSNAKDMDMLTGSLWDKMIIFALPLALTGILQQLYNAADVLVLGRYVSNEAMAAVGNNVPVIGMIVALCMGLALGANVVVARRIGEGNPEGASKAVHTTFTAAVIFGFIFLIAGELIAAPLLSVMAVPEAVRESAMTYLRVYLLGFPFIAIYNFLGAVFRSRGDTRTPLYALAAASIFNIAGNLFFVLYCGMEAGGVALATVLANALSAGILVVRQLTMTGFLRLEFKKLADIDRDALLSIVRIGLPAGLQSMVFSISNLLIQSAINGLGAEVMAGSVAAFTVEINVYCFINAFGLAATTFVAQNYGADNLARCRRATMVSMGLNFVATVMMVALVMTFGRELLGLFSHTQEVIELGLVRLLYVVLPEPMNVVMETMSDAMRGYGYSMPPAIVTLVCVCTTRVIWIYTVFVLEPTYECLMAVYPISWAITTVALVWLYMRHQKKLERKMRFRLKMAETRAQV